MTDSITAGGIRILRVPENQPTDPALRWSSRLLTADEGLGIRTVAYIRTPPGAGSRLGRHSHPFDQCYYILEGTLSLDIAGDTVQAPAGTLLVIPANVEHQNVNRTDRDVLQLMVESREQ